MAVSVIEKEREKSGGAVMMAERCGKVNRAFGSDEQRVGERRNHSSGADSTQAIGASEYEHLDVSEQSDGGAMVAKSDGESSRRGTICDAGQPRLSRSVWRCVSGWPLGGCAYEARAT